MKRSSTNRLRVHIWLAGLALIGTMLGCASNKPVVPSPGSFTPVVSTSNGPIQGRVEPSKVFAFKGVRYGAPPLGEYRFKPPQRPEHWTKVADAGEYGNRAVQSQGDSRGPGALPEMSEDCLFLNVWTPGIDSERRPVMVWLHGGGFSSGAGSDGICDGGNLASTGDVVLVTVNHRLNVFGFLQLSYA